MKNNFSTFKFGYLSWSYWKNWFSNIRQFFRNFRFAYWRAKYGFCEYDIYSLHESIGYLLYNELKYLAEHHYSYPDVGKFSDSNGKDGDEVWTNYLLEMAEHFLNTTECEEVLINKKYNDLLNETYGDVELKFIESPDGNYSTVEFVYQDKKKFDENHKKLDLLELEKTKFKEEEMHKAFKMLEDVYWDLWD